MTEGAVIWLTGVSGAGKTTIAEAIARLAKPRLPELVLIDGDVIRDLFGAGLGYHEAARVEQIGRIQRLAKMLAGQGLIVVVAALYAHPDLLDWNRRNLPGYVEVYVQADMDVVRQRDVKGLYAKAAAGTMPNVVGIDIPWHAPRHPDVTIHSGGGESPEQGARRVMAAVPRLAHLLEG